MLALGIDIGTSFIKVAIVDVEAQICIASAQYPETENEIKSLQKGWAEQSPIMWWEHTKMAILKAHAQKKYNPIDIAAVGISYQMHGLVCVNKEKKIIRDSIIWCDSRAVDIGNLAFEEIGESRCLSHLLNSPGNFTASKLAWVKANEPRVFESIDQIMLPGDFIAMQFTGTCTTSIASLSEGIFWDFNNNNLGKDVFDYFGFPTSIIPPIQNVFSEHGYLIADVASQLSLKPRIPVTYKAGDQPNNALSLNVLQPGEVAANAGTSGVIYGVSDELIYDNQSRINTFAHVNHTKEKNRLGVLLCINGTGILNRWIKNITGNKYSYQEMNEAASKINIGSEGLFMFPFGNGAERMLGNRIINSHILNIDFNIHNSAHLFRAAQEGIAFAFRYGLDIMKENGMSPTIIRAGNANMFLSDVFLQSFVNATNIPVQLFNSDGSIGAAIGAAIGKGFYKNESEAFANIKPLQTVDPTQADEFESIYQQWKNKLTKKIIQ